MKTTRPSTRGKRRGDTNKARTLALHDALGTRKRPNEVRLCLSDAGLAALRKRAAERRVCPSGLAAFYVEVLVRGVTA